MAGDPNEYGLRDYLQSEFGTVKVSLMEIHDRLEAVEQRVATTNGQLISHRMRLESLESAPRQPLITVSEGKVVAKIGAMIATLCATAYGLWTALGHYLMLVPAMFGLVKR